MAMEWTLTHRPAARCMAALAVSIAAVLPAAGCSAPGPAAPSVVTPASGVSASGHWGTAAPVPGLTGRGLNAGGRAGVSSVSCASAGNCTIGGSYRDSHSHDQAYVVSERNGRWGTAIEIPGTAGLNAGGEAGAGSVSCPGAGNCTVSGGYADSHGHGQVFVASERNGRWGTAIEIPGIASFLSSIPGHAGNAEVSAMSCLNGYCLAGPMSCLSTGYCLAGGYYDDYFGQRQAFVVPRR
jgi:hypothetical protein